MNGQERLVAASQALELQHLQTMIRGREKEMHDAVLKSNSELEKSRLYTKEVVDRNLMLESQIEQLSSQLRAMQHSAGDRAKGSVSDVLQQHHNNSSSSASQLPDKQTQNELREARAACARLMEEREVLLEKLVLERDKVAELERKCAHRARTVATGVQTDSSSSAAIAAASLRPDDYRTILQEEEMLPGKEAVEFLRRRIEVEQTRVSESQDACAFHSANIAALHDRLQMRIQGELTKLQTEQDQYARLMSNYQSALLNSGATLNITHTPPPRAPAAATMMTMTTPTPRREQQQVAHQQQALFQRQENEMQNLRRRLQELQARQDDVVVAPGVGGSSLPSPIQHSSILQRMLMNATH